MNRGLENAPKHPTRSGGGPATFPFEGFGIAFAILQSPSPLRRVLFIEEVKAQGPCMRKPPGRQFILSAVLRKCLLVLARDCKCMNKFSAFETRVGMLQEDADKAILDNIAI